MMEISRHRSQLRIVGLIMGVVVIFPAIVNGKTPALKPKSEEFGNILKSRADEKDRVYIIPVQYGFLHLGLNMFFHSNYALEQNYVFVSVHPEVAETLTANKIFNVLLDVGRPAAEFVTLLHISPIVAALSMRLYPVYIDPSSVLRTSPKPYLECPEWDLHIQIHKREEYDTGFFMAKPSYISFQFFQKIEKIMTKFTNGFDSTFHLAIKNYGSLKIRKLNNNARYISSSGENPPSFAQCVERKGNFPPKWRFDRYPWTETMLIWHDVANNSGAYYTKSKNGKFILYENPYDFGVNDTINNEFNALAAALAIGQVLNRTVILPAFHCYGAREQIPDNGKCSLVSFVPMLPFLKTFGDSVRESTYLEHPEPKDHAKITLSPLIQISTPLITKYMKNDTADVSHILKPANKAKGATDEEIKKMLGDQLQFQVIRFRSLYGAFNKFVKADVDAAFKKKIKENLTKIRFAPIPHNMLLKKQRTPSWHPQRCFNL